MTSIHYRDNVGAALQTGLNYRVADHWYLNLDAKQLYLNTDVKVNGAIKAKVALDPTLVALGIGYRF